jgi:hypothetical protein
MVHEDRLLLVEIIQLLLVDMVDMHSDEKILLTALPF